MPRTSSIFQLTNSFAGNENVQYWAKFVDEIFPALRDLTHSVRTGNWDLYLSAFRRCMPLFFVFGKTNYAKYGSLFLQDCLDLKRKFPGIHKVFKKGGFVMYHTDRAGSAVGFDMALEKVYNKPAKMVGGIIGITRRKEAVAQWNLLKHEKDQYVSHLVNQCALEDKDREDELNFHHDFNPSSTLSGIQRFEALFDYISMIGKPLASKRMCNIVTGVEINQDVVLKALECI